MGMIKEDLQVFRDRDPAARSTIDVLLNQPCLYAVWHYRVSHWLWTHRLPLLGRLVSTLSRFLTGVEIHPGAHIGRRLFIDHGAGVVVGETAEIGDDCSLYQGATLGGTTWNTGKRHPTLEKNVIVGAGAKILGPIVVADGARIGSNAVVTKSVSKGVTMVGVPARVVKKAAVKKEECDFEQYAVVKNIIDPMDKRIQALEKTIQRLEQELAEKRES